MTFTPKIDKAIQLAARLHRDQTRNDSERTPYITHLVAVAFLISEATEDEDVIVAGIMHDSLEDVPGYTYEKLVLDCGQRVADIVTQVTEPLDANKLPSEQLPWLERKEAYLSHLREGDADGALVSAADKIHNTESFFNGMREEGEAFVARFGSSIRNRVWFHEQALLIVEEKLEQNNPLLIKFRKCTEEYKELASTLS